MIWTYREATGLLRRFYDVANVSGTIDERRALVCGFADDVVSLVAARGGTMTAEALKTLYADMARWWEQEEVDRLAGHITAHGATVATLQARVEELERQLANLESNCAELIRQHDEDEAEVERLRVEAQRHSDMADHWKERAETAESRLAAIREALDAIRDGRMFRGEHTPEAIAKAALALEGDAPQEAKHECDATCVHPGVDDAETRRRDKEGWPPYPCSATCTHDDASTPGHPERVKEGSEAMWKIVAPDAPPGSPVTCGRCGRAFPGCAEPHGGEPCDVPLPAADVATALGGVIVTRGEPTTEEQGAYISGFDDGERSGAEAMRAACLAEVLDTCDTFGLGPAFRDAVRKAIEVAAP